MGLTRVWLILGVVWCTRCIFSRAHHLKLDRRELAEGALTTAADVRCVHPDNDDGAKTLKTIPVRVNRIRVNTDYVADWFLVCRGRWLVLEHG